eukprot:Colp12_sorted_trinity150504_noHs@7674
MCKLSVILGLGLAGLASVGDLVSLVTTGWAVGNGTSFGIATDCPEKNFEYNGDTFTYCSSFSYSSLKNNTERAMFALMLCALALGAFAILHIVFSFCSRSGGIASAHLLWMQGFCAGAVLILFPSNYGWSLPAGTHMGYSYIIAIIATCLSFFGATSVAYIPVHRERKGGFA